MIEKPNRKKQRKNGKGSSQNPTNKSSFTSENPIRLLLLILEDGQIFNPIGTICPSTPRNARGRKMMISCTKHPDHRVQFLHIS